MPADSLPPPWSPGGALGKPDFGTSVNEDLAGLVAITVPCAFVSAWAAVVIGLAAGALVVFGVFCFDRFRIDDPVGAVSVHLTNGVWRTLSIGLFSNPEGVGFTGGDDGPLADLFYGGGVVQLWCQLVGVIGGGVFTLVFAFVIWSIIKATVGFSVEPDWWAQVGGRCTLCSFNLFQEHLDEKSRSGCPTLQIRRGQEHPGRARDRRNDGHRSVRLWSLERACGNVSRDGIQRRLRAQD